MYGSSASHQVNSIALLRPILLFTICRKAKIYRVRVISENKPWESAINANPNLEDAYLWLLRKKDNNGTPVNGKV